MSDVRLDDLRVPRIDVPWSHLRGAENHRPATVDDLVSALIEEGGEVLITQDAFDQAALPVLQLDPDNPGRYLVFRLTTEEKR